MNTDKTVLIGVPAPALSHTRTWLSMINLILAPPAIPKMVWWECWPYITRARNAIVNQARNFRAEWLLFIDSDMTFPADTLERLLSHDKDIVGATYSRRSPPFEKLGEPLGETPARGLCEMAWMPTGLLLIRMKIFERFRFPFFRCVYNARTEAETGEDIHFGQMARRKGFRIWCDLDLSRWVGHWGDAEFK